MGFDDPIRDGRGELHPLIKHILKCYEENDSPPIQQAPLPISVFLKIKGDYTTELDTACSELIEGALFFAMRSCEYSKTPQGEHKKTTLLELRDIAFFDKDRQSISQMSPLLSQDTEIVKITFRKQKNQDNGQEVLLTRSGHHLCGVEAWCNIIARIRSYQGSDDRTSVNTYFDPSINRLNQVHPNMSQQTC